MNQSRTMRMHPMSASISVPGQVSPGKPDRRRRQRPIRAFRSEDAQQQIAQSTDMLRHFRMDSNDLARALRNSRKAALNRAAHYDPARHAALLRLARNQDGNNRSPRKPDSRTPQRALQHKTT
ncbi:MAG: hypothetical protein AB7E29_00065 [Xanthobacter sp.]